MTFSNLTHMGQKRELEDEYVTTLTKVWTDQGCFLLRAGWSQYQNQTAYYCSETIVMITIVIIIER